MSGFFNTGLSQQQFLDEYWQKKPLLIRNAFATPVTDLTAEDLAGFACEAEIESRLIHQNARQQWSLQHGPLAEADFTTLPARDWTLLVQDMDKHWPPLQALLKPFSFIPNWRRDDIMISFAVPGGSVGAHVDNYDVFLLQAEGTRRWQIAAQPDTNPIWLENCDLRILQNFTADHSWDLQPGDMLYLPPQFAHHGIAQTDCMTISIGFRAPTQRQLLDAFVDALAESDIAEQFYQDKDLTIPTSPGQIDQAAISRAKVLLQSALDSDPALLIKAFGRQVTETKSSLQTWSAPEAPIIESQVELNTFFEQGGNLQRSEFIRSAWYQTDTAVSVFVGGQDYQLPVECVDSIAHLFSANSLQTTDWQTLRTHPAVSELLLAMLAEGLWLPNYDDALG